jgi:hypothetical protein
MVPTTHCSRAHRDLLEDKEMANDDQSALTAEEHLRRLMNDPRYATLPLDKIFDEAVIPVDRLRGQEGTDPFLAAVVSDARESVGGVSLRRILEIAERYLAEGK